MRGLLRRCHRDAAADVARCSGRYGLFIEPHEDEGFVVAAPNLHTRVRLRRADDGFDGDLRCSESAMPMMDDSFALIFLTCCFEGAHDAVGLAAECARLLEPEGTLLVLGLNPLSPARLRWMFGGLRAWSPEATSALLSGLGLEIVGWRYLGARWSAQGAAAIDISGTRRHGSPLRSGFLLEARRRDPGLTPLRVQSARVRVAGGARAGSARVRTGKMRVDQ
ncbi:MAG TPA: methyltransferase domain-containing protein [Xanthomonadaceae bacterium]|jgi:SAM-dependent methyltransferase